jgi:hypothetical protein
VDRNDAKCTRPIFAPPFVDRTNFVNSCIRVTVVACTPFFALAWSARRPEGLVSESFVVLIVEKTPRRKRRSQSTDHASIADRTLHRLKIHERAQQHHRDDNNNKPQSSDDKHRLESLTKYD